MPSVLIMGKNGRGRDTKMKRKALSAACVAAALLVSGKMLLPDLAYDVRQKLLPAFARDGFRELLPEAAERLAAHSEEAAEPQPLSDIAPADDLPPAAGTAFVSYTVEESRCIAAEVPAPEQPQPQPAAVAAFLESQAPFADQTLPENVDYTYLPLPFEYAIPVSGRNSSGFGFRLHPILNIVRFHFGTDFAANAGEAVCAFSDGTVTFAGYDDSYGWRLELDHGDGWKTLYAHCSALYAAEGQRVACGECIALVGATGLATGPHLHFELLHDGVYINPEYYINA